MHVLLIHQAFSAGDEAGGTRHWELGSRLAKYGDRMTVVASSVGYLTGKTARHSRADVQTTVEVLRAPALPVHHRTFAWRITAFVSFALSSIWIAIRVRDVDVVMGTTPPIFQAFSAWIVAEIRRLPFLLEVRDLWPDFAIDMGVLQNGLLIAVAFRVEQWLYRRADIILVNSPAYRDQLQKKGVPAHKIRFVANGVDVSMFDPALTGDSFRLRLGMESAFIALYAGALGMANDLETLLRAAERLRHDRDIQVILVGDGKEHFNLEHTARAMGLNNVTFVGAVPKSRMPEVLAAADVCVATLMNVPMFRTTYPNKVFDYMAAGRPTILGIDGVIRHVIEQSQGGIFVPPGDDAALAEAVQRLKSDGDLKRSMGERAREYVTEHFNRDAHGEQFRHVLKETMETHRKSTSTTRP